LTSLKHKMIQQLSCSYLDAVEKATNRAVGSDIKIGSGFGTAFPRRAHILRMPSAALSRFFGQSSHLPAARRGKLIEVLGEQFLRGKRVSCLVHPPLFAEDGVLP
jgi:hypothetical protein